jgi:HSP20 family molecular chaperone IbpA
MRWLKRLLGATGAIPAASFRAQFQPPRFSETETEVVFTTDAPGLRPETVSVEPEGSSVRVQASVEGPSGQELPLDERIQLPVGSDASGATASCEGTQLIIRIPKSGLHRKTHTDSVDDDETVDS